MNWYILSDDVFLSSALTDMQEHDVKSEPTTSLHPLLSSHAPQRVNA